MINFGEYSWEKNRFVFEHIVKKYDYSKDFGDIVANQAEGVKNGVIEIGKGVPKLIGGVIVGAPKGFLSSLFASAQAFFTGPAVAV